MQSSASQFGLCDDTLSAKKPAYIDELNKSIWIATINNPANKLVNFFAIDNCIEILKSDGKLESRCDGLLLHENYLKFVELKNKGRDWLKGSKQLAVTIKIFKLNYDLKSYDKVEAYLSNKQHPGSNTNYFRVIEEFKDETDLILYVKTIIEI